MILILYAYIWLVLSIFGAFWMLFIEPFRKHNTTITMRSGLASRIEQSEPIKIDHIEQNNRLEELKSKKLNKSQQKILQDAKIWR